MEVESWINRAIKARNAAHLSLAEHETSKSRVIHLEKLTQSLSGAPVDVQDYFREAIMCVEYGLYRAAIVTAWAGHFHTYSECLFDMHESELRSIRPKWKFKGLVELKENYSESQIIDVGKEVKFTSKAKLRVLQGQLSQRNQCAHPTVYRPSMNVAIGYTDELIRQTLSYTAT